MNYSSKNLKLSIVIPTRGRADTLIHTLETVRLQDFMNLEVIISDNVANDIESKSPVKEVVDSNFDPRFKYVSTGKRLGMSKSWEFGLSHATGDYIMFLGDDDGMIKGACSKICEILEKTKTQALVWKKPDYNWPSKLTNPNILTLDTRSELIECNGRHLLRLISLGLTEYGRLPVIYSGIVSKEVVNRIKQKSGIFFSSPTPDVYSGIVLAGAVKNYLYSFEPFSINGTSSHSNGVARGASKKNELSLAFDAEQDTPVHPLMKLLDGAAQIPSCLAEAFLRAQDLQLTAGISLNYYIHTNKILKSIVGQSPARLDELKRFTSLDLPSNVRKRALNYLNNPNLDSSFQIQEKCARNYNEVVIDCSFFGVRNIYDASILISKLRPMQDFDMGTPIKKMSLLSLALTFLNRIYKRKFNNFLLPL